MFDEYKKKKKKIIIIINHNILLNYFETNGKISFKVIVEKNIYNCYNLLRERYIYI